MRSAALMAAGEQRYAGSAMFDLCADAFRCRVARICTREGSTQQGKSHCIAIDVCQIES
jgi:hypothetical protein